MFFFGDSESVAQTYRDAALSHFTAQGHGKLTSSPDEMSLFELKSLLITFRMTHQEASRDGAGQEIIDIITGWYDEAFAMVCEADDSLQKAILENKHFWLNGSDMDNVNKYRRMAGLAPETRSAS